MIKKFKIPFFIAEISANHCGKLSIAKKLIKCAKTNGADAVKLQTYTADSMTIKSDRKFFKINTGLWKGYQLWDLYNEAHTPLAWHQELFNYAKKIGITIFSTPFDEDAVDFLEKLNCPIYKIASFEMTDLNLVKKVSQTKKPIIISTGMANLEEITTTIKVAKKNGAKDIISKDNFKIEEDNNCYVSPSVLIDVDHSMKFMMEETFGPSVGIMKVSSEDEAAKLMNDSPYGLTACVWTTDKEFAYNFGKRINTGTFFMNRCDYLDPGLAWTGVKDTGTGVTLSVLGFDHLTRAKSYHLRTI